VGTVTWPNPKLNGIHSREDLARFLSQMASNLRDDQLALANNTVESFVDSAGRWTRSKDGFFTNVMREPAPENPDWALIAAIFSAALVYE
jgi:hypothetical protein